jgi:hypothetical protein
MKTLTLEQMEAINGGLTKRHWGCFLTGLAAGVASGLNPVVGGLATAACFLLN